MPLLMFACPSTGVKFTSGINTDERSLASVAQLPVTLQCPLCGNTHRLTARSGSFEEAVPAPPAPLRARKKSDPHQPTRDGRARSPARETCT
jgi:hypothetical protein